MRVRKEWVDQEEKLERSKALKYARMLSQKGLVSSDEKKTIEEIEDEPDECPIEYSSNQFRSTIRTRKSVSNAKKRIEFSLQDVACQTSHEYHPSISTRASGKSSLCNRKYLQAGALMMAVNNQCAGQTVMNMYFMDTEVHNQSRTVTLSLQKKYQKLLKGAKKLKAVTATNNGFQSETVSEGGTINKDVTIEYVE